MKKQRISIILVFIILILLGGFIYLKYNSNTNINNNENINNQQNVNEEPVKEKEISTIDRNISPRILEHGNKKILAEKTYFKDGNYRDRIILIDTVTNEEEVLLEDDMGDTGYYSLAAWSTEGKYIYFDRNGMGRGGYAHTYLNLTRLDLKTKEIQGIYNFGVYDVSSDGKFVVYFEGVDILDTTDLIIRYLETDQIVRPSLNLNKDYSFGTAYDSISEDNKKVTFYLIKYTDNLMDPDYRDAFEYDIETGIVTKVLE